MQTNSHSPEESGRHNWLIWPPEADKSAASSAARNRRSESVVTVEWSHCVMVYRAALMAIACQAGEGGFRRAGVGTTEMGVA
jgi:hypothetical protein